MSARSDKTDDLGEIELLQAPALPMTADAIFKDLTHYFGRMLGHTRFAPAFHEPVTGSIDDRLI